MSLEIELDEELFAKVMQITKDNLNHYWYNKSTEQFEYISYEDMIERSISINDFVAKAKDFIFKNDLELFSGKNIRLMTADGFDRKGLWFLSISKEQSHSIWAKTEIEGVIEALEYADNNYWLED